MGSDFPQAQTKISRKDAKAQRKHWNSCESRILPQRDYRTQPGVLTPGNVNIVSRPEGTGDIGSRISLVEMP
jgi:hypothetical protein